MTSDKRPLATIFVTVFLYLVGFGVIIPIVPILGQRFGASELEVSLLLSVYSLMQFLFAPFWGKLSDRFGRRPILLFCLVGEVFSYLLFAFSKSFEVLVVARCLAGFFGASISTASAAISDITGPQERSRGMALIGAAFGLGFLIGPAIGAGLTLLAQQVSSNPFWETSLAAFFVAGLYVLNFGFSFFFLKETLLVKNKTEKREARLALLWKGLQRPVVGPLIGVFFAASLGMAMMETSLVFYVGDRFQWTLKEVNLGFAYVGVVMVICQGFLVRRMLPKWGERRTLVIGLSIFALSLLFIGLSQSVWHLAVAMTLLALGNAFTNPAVLGSVSLLSGSNEQGSILGTTQGTASLGRILGPAFGGWAYMTLDWTAPFFAASGVLFIALTVVLVIRHSLPEAAKGSV